MGTSFSDEHGSNGLSKCDSQYLHRLLSDESNVQEAFEDAVWRHCSSNETEYAGKPAIVESMLQIVGEFEPSAIEPENGSSVGHMVRQFQHVVKPLPDQMTRAEALQLFRTALLALQTALVVQQGTLASSPYSHSANNDAALDLDASGSAEESPLSPAGVIEDFAQKRSTEAQKLSMLRKTAKREDAVPLIRSPIPAIQRPLPSRHELEMENEQMRRSSDEMVASVRQELNVVRNMESLLQARRATTNPIYSYSEDHLEAEAASQRARLVELSFSRHEEEELASELGSETRELLAELTFRNQTRDSLESEMAAEENRSAVLREAFEARRTRYTTAEIATRNAEFSTMRVTRRRANAEEGVQREEEAVEVARSERLEAIESSRSKLEAMEIELFEARRREEEAHSSLGSLGVCLGGPVAADPSTAQSERSAETDMSLVSAYSELAMVEREHDSEVAMERAAVQEIAQLEALKSSLEDQLTNRPSVSPTVVGPQDAAIRELEARLSDMRLHRVTVREELCEAQAADPEGSASFRLRVLGDLGRAGIGSRAPTVAQLQSDAMTRLREAYQKADNEVVAISAQLDKLRSQRGTCNDTSSPTQRSHGQVAAPSVVLPDLPSQSHDGIDPASPLATILKQIESVRYQPSVR